MIRSKRALFVTLSVLSVSLNAMAAQDRVADVIRNDGSVGHFKLLPVHFDPAHAAVVKSRVSFLDDSATPPQYTIPASSLPVVRDQGQRGTCAYFATIGIIESYYIAQSSTNSSLTLSEECLVDVRNWEFDQGTKYTGDDAPDQRPDPNGDLPNSIIKTINENGVPASAVYNQSVDCTYSGDNTSGNDLALSDYRATFTGPHASATYGKEIKFAQNTAPTINTVKALIAAGIPVEVGIVVYNEFMDGTDWRFNPRTDTSDNIAGGHAIILTGYDTTSERGKTIFTFKNSWGSYWGNSGYGTIDDGVLTNSWAYDPSFDFIVSTSAAK